MDVGRGRPKPAGEKFNGIAWLRGSNTGYKIQSLYNQVSKETMKIMVFH